MKDKYLLALAAFAAAMLFAFAEKSTISKRNSSKPGTPMIISCSPDWAALAGWLEEADIPPVPGAGNYKWKITTRSDSAQFYFNQGLNMYYSFHIIEAMASFKKAAKFDPSSAMLYWAQALAYGPNINDLGYAASPEALAAIAKATEFLNGCTDKEKQLILAQQSRYAADSTISRQSLNQSYTENMREIYAKFPNDADVAALYADAMMLEHPWDLWRKDGNPQPWTPLIREVLEKLLELTPNHPGANHYYIHVMEPSPFPAKAMASADRLGKLTPGLSHTVHMPSHIYLRTGFYDKGVTVNQSAVKSYEKVKSLYAPVATNDFLYLIHNLHMQTNNAFMQGDFGQSVLSAAATRESIPADYLEIPGAMGNYIQYIYMSPVLVNVRFGNWDKLLAEPQPASNLVYANLLYHFGKGMALTRKPRMKDAETELTTIRQLMKDSILHLPFSPFSSAIEGAIVAENILAGTIALKEERYEEAILAFQKAVETEDNMVYNEPRDWMLNPKHFLGDAFLKAGQSQKAKAIFEKDLDGNHENGWSLFGCAQALKAQNNKQEADKYLTRFRIAFGKSDVKLYGAVF